MRETSRAWAWSAVGAVTAIALLVPAIYNGFPLVFPDSFTYLKIAYGHYWTLDRSGFYGLMLKPILLPTTGVAGLWLAIAIQAAVVAAVLVATVRRIAPHASARAALPVTLMVALATSLPWHVGQLMPDAFTGALILLTWLAASRDLTRAGSPLLWLAVAALALTHYTHLMLVAVATAVTLPLVLSLGATAREVSKRALAATLAIAVVCGAQVGVNGILFGRWAVAPMGGWFLFARVHDDGLTDRWFALHCGRDAPTPLCQIRGSLPRDSQALLWDRRSPLSADNLGEDSSPAHWAWTNMVSSAAIGSIREQPLRFAGNSVRATVRQLMIFEAADDQCPDVCAPHSLIRFRPHTAPAVEASRQQQGTLHKPVIRAVSGSIEDLGLLFFLPFGLLAWRRRDHEGIAFIMVVGCCVLANAAITGALSDVQPRYQSRVVWLVPFAEILLMLRWVSAASTSGRTSRFSRAAPLLPSLG